MIRYINAAVITIMGVLLIISFLVYIFTRVFGNSSPKFGDIPHNGSTEISKQIVGDLMPGGLEIKLNGQSAPFLFYGLLGVFLTINGVVMIVDQRRRLTIAMQLTA